MTHMSIWRSCRGNSALENPSTQRDREEGKDRGEEPPITLQDPSDRLLYDKAPLGLSAK